MSRIRAVIMRGYIEYVWGRQKQGLKIFAQCHGNDDCIRSIYGLTGIGIDRTDSNIWRQ